MKYLSDYMNEKQTAAFEKAGAFFAFGNEQFAEKRKEGVDYVNMGAGLICPKENANKLHEELKTIYIEAIKEDVAENGAKAIIEREYFNHETQITGDNSGVIDLMEDYKKQFPEQFTDEIILSTCKDCFRQAVINGWF